jgi:hypothetical protein
MRVVWSFLFVLGVLCVAIPERRRVMTENESRALTDTHPRPCHPERST